MRDIEEGEAVVQPTIAQPRSNTQMSVTLSDYASSLTLEYTIYIYTYFRRKKKSRCSNLSGKQREKPPGIPFSFERTARFDRAHLRIEASPRTAPLSAVIALPFLRERFLGFTRSSLGLSTL